MTKLERLQQQKKDIIERYKRDVKWINEQIEREKEREKRRKEDEKMEKEREKKRKEDEKRRKEQQKQSAITDPSYQSFVKDSDSITELKKILEKFLKHK